VSDIKAQVRDAAKRLADNPDDAGAAHELLDLLPRIGHEWVRMMTLPLSQGDLLDVLAVLAEHGGEILETFQYINTNNGRQWTTYTLWLSVPASAKHAFEALQDDSRD